MAKVPQSASSVAPAPMAFDPAVDDRELVRFLLENPIAETLLGGLCSHAVLLGPGRELIAASPDAMASLGLKRPLPEGTCFPLLAELKPVTRGLRFSSWPVKLGATSWDLWLFQDVLADLRHEELEATFFQELLEAVGQLRTLSANPGKPGAARNSNLQRLRELAGQLYSEVELQFQTLLPGGRGTGAEPVPAPVRRSRPVDGKTPPQDLVLVIDDSPMICRMLEVILGAENLRVLTALSGRQGLELALQNEPDLILLDAVMPDLNGFEVCARLKAEERTRDIPVLFVTALRGDSDEVAALHAGAVDFIPKPVHPATVLARVHNHLELKHSRDQLRRLSFVDGLTGIANRRGFDQTLEKEWSRACRNGKPLSLLMGDVDFFKNYNDHLGHATGDECLRRVARVFEEALHRPGDLAARYGGEEFMCILPETDRDGVRVLAELIMGNLVAEGLPHPDSAVSGLVTLSIGLATAQPLPGLRAQALVDEVDRSMYRAKHQGRNRYDQEWL